MFGPLSLLPALCKRQTLPMESTLSVQGKASCPSTNNVRQIYQSGGDVFKSAVVSKAVGTFFEGGHEALPCTG